ncbi:MAG TPA: tripartite tricarboxylate transporter substrate binding protein [Xanthobacteraceae bacterium]|nr:tripartite tricarboxylate transporter substrate binding protein [Xanthobacteraceae bacterium]
MKLQRRELFYAAAGAAVAAIFPRPAAALDYPTRPVKIYEGFGGGGTPDLVSRIIGQWLSERLGQPFVVENRTGAAGNLATEAVVTAPPDGYTLLTCLSANAVNATLYDKLDFNFLHDMAPVAGLVRLPMVLLVNPAFPAQTLPDFIAYAKANPGKINMASPGIGTPMHVAGELFKMMAGVNIVHVPYRGPAGAFTDLLAGQIQAFIITVPAALGFIRTGKLTALAVTSATRADVLPDVPAMAELLPGFDATAWDGTCAPRDTPVEIVDKLNATINAGLADPELKARIKDLGGETMPMSPAQFGKFLADETAKWAKVVQFAGAKAN